MMKDRAILLGWIAGLVLIASLAWSFSFPFRAACLMRGANKALAAANDPRRLESAMLGPRFANSGILGCWYRLSGSDSLFLVFAIMKEGILVPCGAEVSERGEVLGIVPLGGHAAQAVERMPAGLINLYIRRIEAALPKGAR